MSEPDNTHNAFELSPSELHARRTAIEHLKRLSLAHNRAILVGVVFGLLAGCGAVVWAVNVVATSRWLAGAFLFLATFIIWRSVHLHRSMVDDAGRARGLAATLTAILQSSTGTAELAAIEKRFSSGNDLVRALGFLARLKLIHAYVENETHMLTIHSERLAPGAPPDPTRHSSDQPPQQT
jgi:hypothetical protein